MLYHLTRLVVLETHIAADSKREAKEEAQAILDDLNVSLHNVRASGEPHLEIAPVAPWLAEEE